MPRGPFFRGHSVDGQMGLLEQKEEKYESANLVSCSITEILNNTGRRN